MNCKSGTLAFNMCIYDYMDVKGCGVSKLFEDEFLLEVVKSYWLAKCLYVNVTSELAIKLKSKSRALYHNFATVKILFLNYGKFYFTRIFFS